MRTVTNVQTGETITLPDLPPSPITPSPPPPTIEERRAEVDLLLASNEAFRVILEAFEEVVKLNKGDIVTAAKEKIT